MYCIDRSCRLVIALRHNQPHEHACHMTSIFDARTLRMDISNGHFRKPMRSISVFGKSSSLLTPFLRV